MSALGVSPWRAELWGLSRSEVDLSGIVGLNRSRPDAFVGAVIYQAPAGNPFAEWAFAFDDSGRAIVAVVERTTGGALTGSRVVVID
jgi:hypothetical protein